MIKIKKRIVFKIAGEENSHSSISDNDVKIKKLEKELKNLERKKSMLHIDAGSPQYIPTETNNPKKKKRNSDSIKRILKSKSITLTPQTTPEVIKKRHRDWVRDVSIKYSKEFNVSSTEDIDRVDITEKNIDTVDWRLCIVGISEDEIDATLFLKGRPDRMQPSICFLNIPDKHTIEIVDDLLTMNKGYIF